MAAEDEGARDDKPEGEASKSRPRRRRPPVTIDLTAERVADKAEATEAEAPKTAAEPEPEKAEPAEAEAQPAADQAEPEPGAAAQTAEPEPRRNVRPPGASIIGSDDGWTRAALAGVAGGVIALVLLIVLQAIGLVPSPGRSAALAAADQAKAASEAAAALDRRLSAVEMIAQNLPSKSTVDGLSGQVVQIQKELGALATQGDLTILENRLGALTRKVDGLPAGATEQEVAALTDRVATLEAGGAAAGGGSGAGADAGVALAHRIDTVQTGLNALGDRIAAVEGKISAGPADSAIAARAIAIVALRRAVDEGVPFTTDLDLAAALGLPADDVAALRPFAARGVATRTALAAQFAGVGDTIVSATAPADPNAGFFSRLVTGIGSLVTVRPAGPVEGSDPAAIVSRMRAAVEAGDLKTALSERGGLSEAGQEASADWAAAVSDRVAVDALIVKIARGIAPAGGNGPT